MSDIKRFLAPSGSFGLKVMFGVAKPVYDHHSVLIRMENSKLIEFGVLPNGMGEYTTDDDELAEAIRRTPAYAQRRVIEIGHDESLEKYKPQDAVQPKYSKIPARALMACTKDELITIAKDFKITFEEDTTKAELVKMIKEAQLGPKEEGAPVLTNGPDGGIKRVIQKVQ